MSWLRILLRLARQQLCPREEETVAPLEVSALGKPTRSRKSSRGFALPTRGANTSRLGAACYLGGGKAPVGVLLPGQPRRNTSGCCHVTYMHPRLREVCEEHVGCQLRVHRLSTRPEVCGSRRAWLGAPVDVSSCRRKRRLSAEDIIGRSQETKSRVPLGLLQLIPCTQARIAFFSLFSRAESVSQIPTSFLKRILKSSRLRKLFLISHPHGL